MTTTKTRTAGSPGAAGSASDLPGCIRREIQRMRSEDERMGLQSADQECMEAVAFHRWAKRQKNEELSDAILTVSLHCVKNRTCLAAQLAEAARRLRQNAGGQP